MKYYVNEKTYNTKTGKLLKSERLTGDTEDISWARKQMEYRFQQKLKEERDSIKPGAITSSSTKCTLDLKNDKKYVVCIEEVANKIYTASETLIVLNNHFDGNWFKVLDAIQKKDPCGIEEKWLKLSRSPAITLLDEQYPSSLKETHQPPFVLYYKGDLKLLSSKSYIRLAITARRDTHENLMFRVQCDIRSLPQNIIIVTSDKRIAEYALAGLKPHKVILVKACGMDKSTPMIDTWIEMKVIQNGGLVITHLPDKVDAEPVNFMEKNKIMSGIADNLLVVDTDTQGSGIMLVSLFLMVGKDILAYPTFPQCNNCANNSLISEGATLVEGAEDILEAIKSASGYIRKSLASKIEFRCVPSLDFELDTSAEYSQKINDIINSLKDDDNKN